MPTTSNAKRTKRADGLVNVISGLGVAGRDKSVANSFQRTAVLAPSVLEDIYRSGGIGRRIVELPIREMTREWFEVDGDPEGGVLGYLETLKAKLTIIEAMTWADLYGGALVVMGLDDGATDLAEPVDTERLNGIAFFHVYDRHQVTWTTGDLYGEPGDPKFGQPRVFQVTPYHAGAPFRVHETRVLCFKGAPVPPRVERTQQGWADSVLQSPYEGLRNFLAGHAHTANLIEEWAIGVVTIKNLVQLLGSKDGENKVRTRLGVMDYGKAVLRSVLLAEGETFEKKTQSVSGLPDTLDRLAQRVSADTGIPVTLLMGEPPSGLAATGEANRDNWFDDVRGRQEAKLQPQLEVLVRYVMLSKQGPTRGVELPNWKIKFNRLDQPSESETEALRKAVADRDAVYIDRGVLAPEEVAISRFGGDRWSAETLLERRPREGRPERRGQDNGNGLDMGSEA